MRSVAPCSRYKGTTVSEKSPCITFHLENAIAYVTIASPPKNAMGNSFFMELARMRKDVFAALSPRNVRGMVVCGMGRHFSCGADLMELKDALAHMDRQKGINGLLDNSSSFSAIADMPFPVVAAISGCCLGSGLELALACHYRIATKNAVLGLPETTFGLIPGCGGTVRLTKLIGHEKALKIILSGSSMLADEAKNAGIVDLVVEKQDLLASATRYIEENPSRNGNA